MSKFIVIASLLLGPPVRYAARKAAMRRPGARPSSPATRRRRGSTGCARISGKRKIAHSPARRSCRPTIRHASNSNSAEFRISSGTG